MKFILILLLLVIFGLLAPAQTGPASLHLSASRSTILKHSTRFNRISDIQPGQTAALDVYFNPIGQPVKDRLFMGLNLSWYRSGSRIIGNGWATQGTVNLPVWETKRFFSFFSIGLGGIFMGRHFHPVKNPDNVVIGTTFNGFVTVGLRAGVQLSDHVSLVLNGGLSHISNGAFRLPNIGVNTLQTGIGVRYFPNGRQPAFKAPALAGPPGRKLLDRFFNSARAGFGWFQKRGFDGQSFGNLNAGVFQHFEVTRNFTVSAGPSLEYTNYIATLRATYPGEVGSPDFRLGLEGAVEWLYGRIYLKGTLGRYLYKPDKAVSKDLYYYRLGAHYCFKNTNHARRGVPFIGVGLKAYKNVAQHPELTGGFLF